MAMSRRRPGILALTALSGWLAGCAQLQWSSEGPGAPGVRAEPSLDPTVGAPPPAGLSGAPAPFAPPDRERIARVQPWVDQASQRYEVDPDLINAIIWVESRFQPRAKSPAGARGLMQLMPATANAMARQMGRGTPRVFDPEFNIRAGSLFLLQMFDRFDGDETLALAAYNAGAGNVSKWMKHDGELPPRSLAYVENVQRARMRFIAMRDQREHPDPSPARTMIAAASSPSPEPAPRVPPPPGERSEQTRDKSKPDKPEPDKTRSDKSKPDKPNGSRPDQPQPARNPLAPEPGVYKPEPPLEPPLEDTPYPPLFEDKRRPAAGSPGDDQTVELSLPRSLPSVLD